MKKVEMKEARTAQLWRQQLQQQKQQRGRDSTKCRLSFQCFAGLVLLYGIIMVQSYGTWLTFLESTTSSDARAGSGLLVAVATSKSNSNARVRGVDRAKTEAIEQRLEQSRIQPEAGLGPGTGPGVIRNDEEPESPGANAHATTTVTGNHRENILFGSDGGFGACMLIMDDNHFLIEWLAYHYHVLPLKALILAVDPASKTSPQQILNRYQNNSFINTTMYIEQWDDDFYLHDYLNQTKLTKNASEHVHTVEMYIFRQRAFFLECLKRFKQLQQAPHTQFKSHASTNRCGTSIQLSTNISHVAFVDSDEFIALNPKAMPQFNVYETDLIPTPHKQNCTSQTTTVWDVIQRANQRQAANSTLASLPVYQRLTGECLPMPRLLFSTKETIDHDQQQKEDNCHQKEAAKLAFAPKDLLTLRYRHHFGLQNVKKNRKIKSIIQLDQVTPFHLQLDFIHAHRPLKTKCRTHWEWLQPLQGPIIVHHYVGTWEQWTFRDDPRSWTRKRINKYASFSGNSQSGSGGDATVLYKHSAATEWLDGFVQLHGSQKAKQLLKDVGYVPNREPASTANYTHTASNNTAEFNDTMQ